MCIKHQSCFNLIATHLYTLVNFSLNDTLPDYTSWVTNISWCCKYDPYAIFIQHWFRSSSSKIPWVSVQPIYTTDPFYITTQLHLSSKPNFHISTTCFSPIGLSLKNKHQPLIFNAYLILTTPWFFLNQHTPWFHRFRYQLSGPTNNLSRFTLIFWFLLSYTLILIQRFIS